MSDEAAVMIEPAAVAFTPHCRLASANGVEKPTVVVHGCRHGGAADARRDCAGYLRPTCTDHRRSAICPSRSGCAKPFGADVVVRPGRTTPLGAPTVGAADVIGDSAHRRRSTRIFDCVGNSRSIEQAFADRRPPADEVDAHGHAVRR